MNKREKIQRAKKFANGRPSASGGHYLGHDMEKALSAGKRWLPRLAGTYVRSSGDPTNGYATREEAIAAARRFQENCRGWLTRHAS